MTRGQIAAVANLPFVESIESSEDEDGIFSTSSSVQTVDAAASEIDWNLTRVRAPEMWSDMEATGERQLTGSTWQSAVIGVLDTGGDYRLTYNAAGWQFAFAAAASPANYTASTDSVYLGEHGTWVAGFAAAEPDDADVAGVAPRAGIRIYKVLPSGSDWGPIVDGLDQAYSDGVSVVNMSLGNCGAAPPGAVDTAISRFATRVPSDAAYPSTGVSLVAAAGNGTLDGCETTAVHYPGAYSDVIAVSAIDDDDDTLSGLSVGPAVELAAPGLCVDGLAVGGGVDECISGSSFAAPHVAGTIAAIRALRNDWSAAYVRSRLQATASKVSGQSLPRDNTFGYGVVDGYRALAPEVDVTGPSFAYTGQSTNWSSALTAGFAPFSYQWHIDGTPAGTASSLSYTPGGSDFWVKLTVTDDKSLIARDSIYVTNLGCVPPELVC